MPSIYLVCVFFLTFFGTSTQRWYMRKGLNCDFKVYKTLFKIFLSYNIRNMIQNKSITETFGVIFLNQISTLTRERPINN